MGGLVDAFINWGKGKMRTFSDAFNTGNATNAKLPGCSKNSSVWVEDGGISLKKTEYSCMSDDGGEKIISVFQNDTGRVVKQESDGQPYHWNDSSKEPS